MEIQQQLYRAVRGQERHEQLREGELHRATVQERISKNEALLTIRGREVKATFEGEVPKGDRVNIQIVENKGDTFRVRLVNEEPRVSPERAVSTSAKPEITQTLRQFGVSQPSPELRQAAQMLTEKGIPLTKDSVQALQRFLSEGNKVEKLETVQALANKRLQVTTTHLSSIHEALHGKPLNEVFHELAREIDKNFKVEPVRQVDSRRPTEVMQEARRRVAKEGVNERTLQAVRNEIEQLPRQQREQLARAVDEAETLQRNGKSREAAARLIAALDREINNEAQRERAHQAERQPRPEPSTRQVDGQGRVERQVARSIARDTVQVRTQLTEQLHQLERSVPRRDENFVRAVREVIDRAPSLERGVEQARQLIQESSSRPVLDRPSAETVQRVQALLEHASRDVVRQPDSQVRADRQVVNTSPRETTQVRVQVTEQLQQLERSVSRRDENFIRAVREVIDRAPNLERGLEQARQLIQDSTSRSVLDRPSAETVQRVQAVLEQASREVARQPDSQVRADRQVVNTSPRETAQVRAQVTEQLHQLERSVSRRDENFIRAVREVIDRAPNLERGLDQARQLVQENASRPVLDRSSTETIQRVQAVLEQASREAARQMESQVNTERQVTNTSPRETTQVRAQVTEQLQQFERTVPRRDENFVRAVRDVIDRAPNLERGLEQARQLIQESSSRSVLDRPSSETVQRVQAVLEQASREVARQTESQISADRQVMNTPPRETTQVRAQVTVQLQQLERSVSRRDENFIRAVREVIDRAPNLERGLEQARQLVQESASRPVLDRPSAETIQRVQALLEQASREVVRQSDTQVSAARQVVNTSPRETPQVRAQVTEQLQQLERSVSRRDENFIRAVREVISKAPNLERGMEQARQLLQESSSRPVLDRPSSETSQRVQAVLEQASREVVRQSDTQVRADRQAMNTTPRETTQVRTQVTEQLQQLERSVPRRDENFVRAVREVISNAPSLERGLDQARQLIQESSSRTPTDRPSTETLQRVQAVLDQASREIARQQTTQPQQERIEPNRNTSQEQANNHRPTETQRDVIQRLQNEVARSESITRASSLIREQLPNQEVSKEVRQLVERSVAEANHLNKIGRERLAQVVQQLENSATTEQERTAIREIRSLLQQEASASKIAQASKTLTASLQNEEVKQQLNRALIQAEQLEKAGRERMLQALAKVEQQLAITTESEEAPEKLLAQTLKEAREGVQKEANFTKALEQLQSVARDNRLTNEDRAQLQRAIDTASQRMEQGRELAARQEVINALQQLEQKHAPQEPYESQEVIQAASKAIAVTTITEKLAQMTADFKQMQREITRTLDVVSRQIDQLRAKSQTLAKPLLEATIKKLDNAILRSDMMLLTDMKTEKRLMQASSQLADAKKLLEKGQYSEASRIVKEVKQLIERLNFKPSETKIKHYTALNERSADSFPQQYKETLRTPVQDGSARAMFDYVRSLGLNRDSEIAHQLVGNRQGFEQQQQEEAQRDMKSALLKLLSSEEEGSRTKALAQQALANVTGQQLLSRSDQQGTMQNMFFNLPFLLQEKVENLQVFVNARNGDGQLDWENCQLYFLIETPRLGEIGIMLNVVERQLSVTLKNDKNDFEMKMAPLVDETVKRLEELGYSLGGISYAPLTPPERAKTEAGEERTEKQRPIFTKEGFDFKI